MTPMNLFAARADDELSQLASEAARMGGLAERQVADAVLATARRDLSLARAVAARDGPIDDAQREIDRRAVFLIASRRLPPEALRQVLASMKLAASLERTGDLARNIARRAEVIAASAPMTPLIRPLERMGQLVVGRLSEALDAYARQDVDRAMRVWSRDQEVDELYNAIFRELLTFMTADAATITPCTHLLFVAKNLERIGDHATTVAELAAYQATGFETAHDRPKGLLAV